MSVKARWRHGLTMVELVIFIVVVSIGVIGILQVITLNTRNSADPMRRKQALAIAESLIEEVRLASFTYCDIADPNVTTASSPSACTTPEVVGPELANNNIRPFDNVNDYVSQLGTAQTYTTDVAGVAGVAFPAGYTATVTINADATLGPVGAKLASDGSSANMNVLRITVTVTYGSDSVVLETYRTRYAPNSVPVS
ncbi:MAG: hypothetical protein K2X55_17665 [Burkholderiaceae bacterium]|nr:hypothetical protein [Burkholderiaceae bacterium]